MAVRCSKCGEDLLGPVNRCWKCGQQFATLPDSGGLPPVRREGLASVAAAAAVAPQATASESGEAVVPAEMASPASSPSASAEGSPASASVRTGSPFIPGATMLRTADLTPTAAAASTARGSRPTAPATQDLIRDQLAVAGAIGSLVLGGFALSVAWMADPTAVIGGAMIAILGLGMGIWGLHSRRRGWALFAMLICVAAISLATYSGAMLIYEAQLAAKELEGQIE